MSYVGTISRTANNRYLVHLRRATSNDEIVGYYDGSAWTWDKLALVIKEIQSASTVSANGGTATISFPTGVTRNNIIIVGCYLFHNSNKYYGSSGGEVVSVENDGIHVKNNGGAANYIRVLYSISG